MKLALIEFHLNVAAASIELVEFAQCTSLLNGVLAQVQARVCIDMAPSKRWTLVQTRLKCSFLDSMTTVNRYMKKFFDYKFCP